MTFNKLNSFCRFFTSAREKKFTQNIENPFIIIVGIANYYECDESGKSNIPSAENDARLLYKLWTKQYNYKNVRMVIDKVNRKLIDCEVFKIFLDNQVKTIVFLPLST